MFGTWVSVSYSGQLLIKYIQYIQGQCTIELTGTVRRTIFGVVRWSKRGHHPRHAGIGLSDLPVLLACTFLLQRVPEPEGRECVLGLSLPTDGAPVT